MSAEFRGTRYYVAWDVAERGPLFRLCSPPCPRSCRGTAAKIADEIGLTPDDVRSLDARDFRHAATTDAAGKSNEIEGIAYTLGHKDLRTTSRYLDADRKSARRVLEARFGMGIWDGIADDEVDRPANMPESLRTRRDSNPRLLPPEPKYPARIAAFSGGFGGGARRH